MSNNISTINTFITNTLTTSFYNNSTIPGAAYNEQHNDSSLSSSYIALIISLIGLCSTILVSYNIKNIRIFCIKFECIKKEIDDEKCNTNCNHHCNEHKNNENKNNEHNNFDDDFNYIYLNTNQTNQTNEKIIFKYCPILNLQGFKFCFCYVCVRDFLNPA